MNKVKVMPMLPDELELSVEYLRGLPECTGLQDAEIREMAVRAIEIGSHEAMPFIGADLVNEAAKRKIALRMMQGGVYGNRLLRAQYDHTTRTITVYETGVKTVLDTPAPSLLGIEHTVEAVRNVLMWHEFFHVLEFTSLGLVGKKFTLPGKILWFNTKKPLYKISEISANAFAMRALCLLRSPFIIDWTAKNMDLFKDEEEART